MPFRKAVDAVRESLWFVPTIWVVVCVAAAFGVVAIDGAVAPDLATQVPLVFGGGPEGARGLLSAIASSTVTVVGVVFSITIVALQLASQQYSPRVLRNFMRDRPSQMTLGSFIGAFVYSLLVLRTVRNAGDGQEAFVPVLGVTGALVLAVVAVGMLVYFIHHIAARMQVSHITAEVARETMDEIERQAKRAGPASERHAAAAVPSLPGTVFPADGSGYLQYVEVDGLRAVAESRNIVVALELAPGDWVQDHGPLFRAWGEELGDDLQAELQRHVSVGDERVVYQDPEFGIQQLVDIAVKALSPGINDPTTARTVLDRLVQVLVVAGRARATPEQHFGEDGSLRLIVRRTEFGRLVQTAFSEIHHFGRDIPSVARALAEALATVEALVDEEHRPTIAAARRLHLHA